MTLLIIGASDAGIAAGLRARQLDPSADVHVLAADAYPNFSICGLPYWISREVPDWRHLAHRSADDLRDAGLQIHLDTRAERIDPDRREVTVTSTDGEQTLRYDQLVIGTGAEPVVPDLPGIDLPGVHLLHHMADAFALDEWLGGRPMRSAVIVGAGYIGLEMAEALSQRGIATTVIERLPEVLPTVDPELGRLVRAELERRDVAVRTGTQVLSLEVDDDRRLKVITDTGETEEVDVVLVSVGVRPNSDLARRAGVAIDGRGRIIVEETMVTSVPDVWAAGDCVHTHHRLLPEPGYIPLGTTAHKQGRVAGENALGGHRRYAGSLGTQVVKIFDLAAARTGLRDHEAQAAGYEPVTVAAGADDHKRYYPGAHEIAMRWTADRRDGRLLGCQLVGHVDSQVPKRVDVVAAAIHSGLAIDEVSDLDLSYTPPFGSPWDALQAGAQRWNAAVGETFTGTVRR